MTQAPTIDALLNLAAEHPAKVLDHLRSHPDLASQQDAHGYSLLHASISYNHADLARALATEFSVDPNILDEDGETCLYGAESVEIAQLALELGTDPKIKNEDGQTAEEKLADEDEQPQIAEFLRLHSHNSQSGSQVHLQNGALNLNGNGQESVQSLPPLPPGVHINLGTMSADDAGDAPDPELRRRIEELAARDDFDSAATQGELRELISDALSSVRSEEEAIPPASRRRVE